MTWVKSYCGGKPNYTTGGDMDYEEFKEFILTKSLYETLYHDTEGRLILIIKVSDALQMAKDFKQKELNEIIYHLRMEIKRLQEIITEAKH
jgi:hypothetical protein